MKSIDALVELSIEWEAQFGSEPVTVDELVDVAMRSNPKLLDALRKVGSLYDQGPNRTPDVGYYAQLERAFCEDIARTLVERAEKREKRQAARRNRLAPSVSMRHHKVA